jgi:hypothetical protein
MLRLTAQAETLWDEALPIEVRQLPEDLAALDELLCDPALLARTCSGGVVAGPAFPFVSLRIAGRSHWALGRAVSRGRGWGSAGRAGWR